MIGLGIRIKASDDPAAVKALKKVNGRIVEDKLCRKSFVFSDQTTYYEYCRLVRLYKAK